MMKLKTYINQVTWKIFLKNQLCTGLFFWMLFLFLGISTASTSGLCTDISLLNNNRNIPTKSLRNLSVHSLSKVTDQDFWVRWNAHRIVAVAGQMEDIALRSSEPISLTQNLLKTVTACAALQNDFLPQPPVRSFLNHVSRLNKIFLYDSKERSSITEPLNRELLKDLVLSHVELQYWQQIIDRLNHQILYQARHIEFKALLAFATGQRNAIFDRLPLFVRFGAHDPVFDELEKALNEKAEEDKLSLSPPLFILSLADYVGVISSFLPKSFGLDEFQNLRGYESENKVLQKQAESAAAKILDAEKVRQFRTRTVSSFDSHFL